MFPLARESAPLRFKRICLDLLKLWAGRISGSLSQDDYTKNFAQIGFNQIGIETARVYGRRGFRLWSEFVVERLPKELEGKFVGTFVRANKAATVLWAWLPQNNDYPNVAGNSAP